MLMLKRIVILQDIDKDVKRNKVKPSRIRRAMELLSSGRVKEGDKLFATLIALITGELDGGDE